MSRRMKINTVIVDIAYYSDRNQGSHIISGLIKHFCKLRGLFSQFINIEIHSTQINQFLLGKGRHVRNN